MHIYRYIEVRRFKELIWRIFNHVSAVKTEAKPYYMGRFRWWEPFDLKRFVEDHNRIYEIDRRPDFAQEGRIEIFLESRREIRVKADTLYAFLKGYRAVLIQKEIAPLTIKDRELEEFVIKKYPHTRETPFI